MNWTIDGISTPVQRDIELSATTLSLSAVVEESALSDWETFGEYAGDLQTTRGAGGQFRTASRGTEDTITVEPPAELSPPFASSEWYVAGLNVEQVAPDRYRVSVNLQRPTNRQNELSAESTTGFGLNFGRDFGVGFDVIETALTEATTGFGLNFGRDFGVGSNAIAIALTFGDGDGDRLTFLDRQLGQLSESGSPTGEQVELPLVLSDPQAAALVDAAGAPDAIVERSVPDGQSFVADSSGGEQTAVIDVRDAGVDVPSGRWLIRDWTLSWQSHAAPRRWRATLTLQQP